MHKTEWWGSIYLLLLVKLHSFIHSFIHSFMYLLPYMHLQVHPKDVETVTIQYTIYLFSYRQYNCIYNLHNKLSIHCVIKLLQSRMYLIT